MVLKSRDPLQTFQACITSDFVLFKYYRMNFSEVFSFFVVVLFSVAKLLFSMFCVSNLYPWQIIFQSYNVVHNIIALDQFRHVLFTQVPMLLLPLIRSPLINAEPCTKQYTEN